MKAPEDREPIDARTGDADALSEPSRGLEEMAPRGVEEIGGVSFEAARLLDAGELELLASMGC